MAKKVLMAQPNPNIKSVKFLLLVLYRSGKIAWLGNRSIAWLGNRSKMILFFYCHSERVGSYIT